MGNKKAGVNGLWIKQAVIYPSCTAPVDKFDRKIAVFFAFSSNYPQYPPHYYVYV